MLEGRVALITGAGRGIGRQHALYFASLGAKVLVNDVGAASDGSETSATAAQQVVDEISAAGGEAIANTDSVSDFGAAKRMVESAVEAFGDLHIVVNNAGILRDRMLVSMSEVDFDSVIAVHVKGTFNMCRHAAEHWRERAKGGDPTPRAIVNTSSGSGLHGIVGQANYGGAKAAIANMTIVLAQELGRYNTRVNCIAPIARTRLTLQTPGMSDVIDDPRFDAANISPLVAYLASERCAFTGQVFSVYGGSVGIYRGWSMEAEVTTDGRWQVDDLARAMEAELPRELTGRTSGALAPSGGS